MITDVSTRLPRARADKVRVPAAAPERFTARADLAISRRRRSADLPRHAQEMPSRGRILIVDDEANARAALSEILHDEGYVTETAADGFKALGKLEDFHPDVVLTDLKMPGLDGIAFMEKAKAASPETAFVVMTAFGTISSAVAR